MNRRWNAAFFRLGLAVALGGCASQPNRFKPIGLTPVTIPADEELVEIHTLLGYELKLTLPPPKRLDYVWDVASADPRYLQQTVAPKRLDDGTGAMVVTFLARRRGRTMLTL